MSTADVANMCNWRNILLCTTLSTPGKPNQAASDSSIYNIIQYTHRTMSIIYKELLVFIEYNSITHSSGKVK